MGLRKLFGTVVGGLVGGPLGASIGGGLGGAADERQHAKNSAAYDANRFVRLRQAAEAGGFHPLEALRAGGASPTTAAPRLMSNTASANAFDYFEQQAAQKRDDLLRAEQDAEKKRNAANNSLRGSLGTRGATEARAAEGTVTNVSAEPKYLPDGKPNPDFEYSKPNQIDFGVVTERYGEAELVEQIAFPINWAADRQYNWLLREISQITGRPREDLHNEAAAGGSGVLREWTGLMLNKGSEKEGTGNSPLSTEFWGLPKFPKRNPQQKAPPVRVGPPVRY